MHVPWKMPNEIAICHMQHATSHLPQGACNACRVNICVDMAMCVCMCAPFLIAFTFHKHGIDECVCVCVQIAR